MSRTRLKNSISWSSTLRHAGRIFRCTLPPPRNGKPGTKKRRMPVGVAKNLRPDRLPFTGHRARFLERKKLDFHLYLLQNRSHHGGVDRSCPVLANRPPHS